MPHKPAPNNRPGAAPPSRAMNEYIVTALDGVIDHIQDLPHHLLRRDAAVRNREDVMIEQLIEVEVADDLVNLKQFPSGTETNNHPNASMGEPREPRDSYLTAEGGEGRPNK